MRRYNYLSGPPRPHPPVEGWMYDLANRLYAAAWLIERTARRMECARTEHRLSEDRTWCVFCLDKM